MGAAFEELAQNGHGLAVPPQELRSPSPVWRRGIRALCAPSLFHLKKPTSLSRWRPFAPLFWLVVWICLPSCRMCVPVISGKYTVAVVLAGIVTFIENGPCRWPLHSVSILP